MKNIRVTFLAFASAITAAHAGEVFVEAESFKSPGGWVAVSGPVARTASGLAMLNGASGA